MIDQYTLYLDNFRGFKDTYVPLLDVNFLVGENSSGKTSLLSLLKLMGAERLLVEREFSDDDVSLGPFHDIVSAHTEDPNYFRIGMIRRETLRNVSMPLGVLVMYEKHEGLPLDTCLTCTFEHKEICVRRRGKHLYYRVRPGMINATTKMVDLFPRWIEDQHEQKLDKDFKKFNFHYEPEVSLLFPLSAVAQELQPRFKDHVSILNPILFQPPIWIAPIRSKPSKTYDAPTRSFSAEGFHTPYLIRKLLTSHSQAKRFSRSISNIGKASGLFKIGGD